MTPTPQQRDLARRLILAGLKADAETPLIAHVTRDGWIRWRVNPPATPQAGHAPAGPMSDAGRVRFLKLLAKSIGVDAFVRLCDDIARQQGHETLSAFLDRAAPGWRNRRAA